MKKVSVDPDQGLIAFLPEVDAYYEGILFGTDCAGTDTTVATFHITVLEELSLRAWNLEIDGTVSCTEGRSVPIENGTYYFSRGTSIVIPPFKHFEGFPVPVYFTLTSRVGENEFFINPETGRVLGDLPEIEIYEIVISAKFGTKSEVMDTYRIQVQESDTNVPQNGMGLLNSNSIILLV